MRTKREWAVALVQGTLLGVVVVVVGLLALNFLRNGGISL